MTTRRQVLQAFCAPALTSGALVAATILPGVGAARAEGTALGFYEHFKGLKLVDQNGATWRPDLVLGQLLVVNFVFTGCSSICPIQTHALVQMQRQLPANLAGRVKLLSVSLDPLSDTPKTLKAFARRFSADTRNWSFVTGRPQDIERLAEALWLFRSGKKKDRLDDHSTSLWLVDAQGELRARLGGNPPQVGPLIQALTELADPSGASRS